MKTDAAGCNTGTIVRKFTARSQTRARSDAYGWAQCLHLGANAVGRPIISVTIEAESSTAKSVTAKAQWREMFVELL